MGVVPVSQKTRHDMSKVLKLDPVIATDLPAGPLFGDKGDIVGLFTVNGAEIDTGGYTYAFVIVTAYAP
jgi:hypothetical protein